MSEQTPKRKRTKKERAGITLIDGVGLHNAINAYSRKSAVRIDGKELKSAIFDIRTRFGYVEESRTYAYMSVNYESPKQMDLVYLLEDAGIHVISLDYKTTAVHTARMKTKNGDHIPMNTSVAPHISYALGMIAQGDTLMDVLLIAQSFELDYAMRACRKDNHRVALAYWKPWLDRRYGMYSDIDFFDLENLPHIFEGSPHGMFPNPDESPYEATEVPVPVLD